MKRHARISVIIPNYQGKDIFPACIRSLLAQHEPVQVVFVDDSSTDGSYERAQELFGRKANVVVTRTERNSGFVGACNHGLAYCTGDWVIPGNNDVIFPKGWSRAMLAAVRGKRKIIGASMFVKRTGDPWIEEHVVRQRMCGTQTLVFTDAFRRLADGEYPLLEVPVAGCLMLPRKALKGYIFEPDYFAYGEDVNCSWRLRLQGYRIVMSTRAVGVTEGSYTRKKVKSFNRKAIYYGTRNMILNFLTVYEGKNVVRLWLPFWTMQLGAVLSNPLAAPLRLKAWGWVLVHPREILRRRRGMQRLRKLPDRELFRLLSHKVFDERIATTRHAKLVARMANACMRVYLRLVGLRTFDRDDPAGHPDVHGDAVRETKAI